MVLDDVMSALRRIRDLAKDGAVAARRRKEEEAVMRFESIRKEAERTLEGFP